MLQTFGCCVDLSQYTDFTSDQVARMEQTTKENATVVLEQKPAASESEVLNELEAATAVTPMDTTPMSSATTSATTSAAEGESKEERSTEPHLGGCYHFYRSIRNLNFLVFWCLDNML